MVVSHTVEASELVAVVLALQAPAVVGVSGYGGSGKTTLATWLATQIPGAVRLRGDDFLDPERSHRRSNDWDGVERQRLVTDVLQPFRCGASGYHRRYDWALRQLGDAVPNPVGDILVVDLIGLFHPDVLEHLDLCIWVDVELAAATERGIARDAALGRDHRTLWQEVWVPNERDFESRFSPRLAATHVYKPIAALPLVDVSG